MKEQINDAHQNDIQSYFDANFVAGHSMLGLSLGAGTGKLVAELAGEKQMSVDLGVFALERFG